MSCARQGKCDNGKLCKYANGDDYKLLGGSCYKPKVEQTNEEWIHTLNTEGLVDLLYDVHYGGASVVQKPWIAEHKERIKMQYRGWLKAVHK